MQCCYHNFAVAKTILVLVSKSARTFFYYRSFQPQAIRHNRQRHGRATKIQTTYLLRIAYLCHKIFCRTNALFSEWGN